VPDTNGDEIDGLDEALCPYDLQTGGGALIDDEINTLFSARKAGVRLVLISDSCHSGTVTPLPPPIPTPTMRRARASCRWATGCRPTSCRAASAASR
jgi:hypothetical protein